jgi:hypothetical protein
VSSRTSRPDRRRGARDAGRAPQRTKRPATPRRGGSFLNTLIVALLVVLAVMAAVFLVLVLHVTG